MKKRIFLDTNVMLDFLGERVPFYRDIAKILSLSEKEKFIIVVSPISYATVNYFLSKFENSKIAIEKLRKFKIICEVCDIDELIIEKSLHSGFQDFEDAVQYYSALKADCKTIITRDPKGFLKSKLPIMSPNEYLTSLKK